MIPTVLASVADSRTVHCPACGRYEVYGYVSRKPTDQRERHFRTYRCRCGNIFVGWQWESYRAPQANQKWIGRRVVRTRDIKREVGRLVASSRPDQIAEILREIDQKEP